MWKTRFCEPLNYWLTLLFDMHILKTAGGPAASAPYRNSPIFSVPTLLKLNSSIRSYTLLYRVWLLGILSIEKFSIVAQAHFVKNSIEILVILYIDFYL